LKSPTDKNKYDLGDAVILELDGELDVEADVEATSGFLIDATSFQETSARLLELIVFEREILGENAKLVGKSEGALLPQGSEALSCGRLLLGDQTNTNYQFGERS